MRKNALFSAMAATMLLAASCSQEEILSGGQEVNAPITIQVNAPVKALSRAAVTLPDGYRLDCIMQLRDADGITYTQTVNVDAATGAATFTVPGDEASAATTALFWAQYVNTSDETAIYNTDDLTSIGYAVTEFTPELMAAADAFCGSLTSLTNGASVELTRPFARINAAKPSNANEVSAGTMTLSYTTTSGYNVGTGQVASGEGAGTAITYTDSSFDPNDEVWFSNFIFAGNNVTTLGSDITMNINGTTYTISGEDVPLDANFDINGSFTLGEGTVEDLEFTVNVNPDYDEPTIEVGNYIYADGTFGTNSENAVGIVFALAEGKTDNSSYGEGKTPVAYAMGLTSVTRSNLFDSTDGGTNYPALTELGLSNTSDDIAAPWAEGDYNGYTYTQTFETALESSSLTSTLFTNYETWKTENALTGTNLSGWYIPSPRQLADLIGATYGSNEIEDSQASTVTVPAIAQITAVSDAVNAIWTDDGSSYFGRRASASNIFTPFIRSGRVMCVQTSYTAGAEGAAGTEATAAYTGITVNAGTSGAPFSIRPIVTIFE